MLKKTFTLSAKILTVLSLYSAVSFSQAQTLSPKQAPLIGGVDSGAVITSQVALVLDLKDNQVLYEKNSNTIQPIASISKLLTALVITQAKLPMDELITITDDDVDRVKKSSSRLQVGTALTRKEALLLALMSSENRAAHALGRTFPGGMQNFVHTMNNTARSIGMTRSRFVEPTGLSPSNVSTPRDLVRLLHAVSQQHIIHEFTTSDDHKFIANNGKTLTYRNTNRLIRNPNWKINISKTGYIREAGECLVMLTEFEKRPVAVVLLNAQGGAASRFKDAIRVRHLVQNDYPSLF